MNSQDFLQVTVYLAMVLLCATTLGAFMARIFIGDIPRCVALFRPIEKLAYRFGDINSDSEMNWKEYARALVGFNLIGIAFVFLLQIFQSSLPLNPQHLPNVSWDSAFNTAVSFVSNTNWQGYAGETTMSQLTQMLALATQNFLSAATGIAVMLALIRGFARSNTDHLGNFWTDLTRSVIYVLLPLSIIFAIFLISQGVIQNFSSAVTAHTLQGGNQLIPMGPAASQIAIKQLGTNGGGFFNANSAHPFENTTPLCNFFEMLALLALPAALPLTYGKLTKQKKHGWILFGVMSFLFIAGLAIALWAEYHSNPITGVAASPEGKELRFGTVNSIIWAAATTVTSNGSVNSMHSSLSPLAGGIALFNIMLGEIVFGGIGSGMYGMILFVLMTVFLCGLMVGRTPEYLGKKIETREIALVIAAILLPNICILVGSSLACVLPQGLSSLASSGPHGLSEILYAFSSASQNNGSAFAGLNANTVFYNIALGICMFIGRFSVIIPTLAIAGSIAQKRSQPASDGTFSTDNWVFALLLVAVILIVGALTFFPALALGPIVEHLLMNAKIAF